MATIINETDDFTSNALADFGQTVSRTPVTTNRDINGHEQLTDGTPVNITAVYHRSISEYAIQKYGLSDDVNAYLMVAPTTAINRNDKITASDRTYRVIAVIDRGSASTSSIYKFVTLAHID